MEFNRENIIQHKEFQNTNETIFYELVTSITLATLTIEISCNLKMQPVVCNDITKIIRKINIVT